MVGVMVGAIVASDSDQLLIITQGVATVLVGFGGVAAFVLVFRWVTIYLSRPDRADRPNQN